jgi:cold shock CspA family protein
MNKRGQFYLLAAIVIIALIIGFASVSNYAKKKTDVKLYDLADELKIESGEVVQYGIYNEFDEDEMNGLLLYFSGAYDDLKGEDKNMYFVMGNSDNVFLYSFTEVLGGEVTIDFGSTYAALQISNRQLGKTLLTPEGNKVTVEIEGVSQEFDLKPGQNFWFVISQDAKGNDEGRYYVRSE